MIMRNVEPRFTSLFNGKDLTGWVYGRRGTAENKSGTTTDLRGTILGASSSPSDGAAVQT